MTYYEEHFEKYLDEVPLGWRKITEDFLRKLADLIEKQKLQYEDFQILDIKEKFGEGRCYTNFSTTEVDELIDDWTSKTANTCVSCGKIATHCTSGYILPFCDKCSF